MSITDPTVMRALAHPIRIALIELLGVRSTLTATQASEALGESPANCAFHLRTLAKYGFIEEAGGGRGRERPWRPTDRSRRLRLSVSEQQSEQAKAAAGALERVWHDQWFARAREAFANRNWPEEWRSAAGSSHTITYLTAPELQAFQDEFNELVSRRVAERRDPAKRPPGALPVEIVAFGYPRVDLAAQLSANDDDDNDNDTDDFQDIS